MRAEIEQNPPSARRRIGERLRPRPSLRRLLLALLAAALLLLAARAFSAYRALTAARADVATLRALSARDPASLASADLDQAAASLTSLEDQLGTLDAATTLPPGGASIVAHLPWLGPRYVADRRLLRYGRLLAVSGHSAAVIGAETLGAFQATGVQVNSNSSGPTWLDIVAAHRDELIQLGDSLDRARAMRAGIDTRYLPAGVRDDLPRLDRTLDRLSALGLDQDLPAALTALGADHPVRYLVLFQNPAELRPSGGFPGTMGLVTLDRGRLVSYEIFDGHQLTNDYIAQRTEKLPQPWPIQQYFPQDGFLLHDAGWYADFPRAGTQIMAMYAETDWPAIDGVIGVEPAAVVDLLKATGPIDVEIDGELRHVTADNVYDEIERQRRLVVEGVRPYDPTRQPHKEAVASIGVAILERLKQADHGQLRDASRLLLHSADVRDIQVYSGDPAVEQAVDRHGWSGRLQFDNQPQALAVTFANVALGKSSQYLHPTLTIDASAPVDGQRAVKLTITLNNTGPVGEDPLYSGFQNWWVAIEMPRDFRGQFATLPLQPDPDSPNGGSFIVPLQPQQQQSFSMTFTMPAGERFVLRRQPGLTPAQVQITSAGCAASRALTLTRDTLVDLDALCAPAP